MRTRIQTISRPLRRVRAGLAGLAVLGLCASCSSPQRSAVSVTPVDPNPTAAGPGVTQPSAMSEGSEDLRPSQAQVAEVRGTGSRGKNPGRSWRKLRPGDWLPMGASLETAPGSSLSLRLYETGVLVQVKPDSLLCLENLSYRMDGGKTITSTLLDLQKGEVAVDDSNLAAGSTFEIRTPQGLTRIPPRAEK